VSVIFSAAINLKRVTELEIFAAMLGSWCPVVFVFSYYFMFYESIAVVFRELVLLIQQQTDGTGDMCPVRKLGCSALPIIQRSVDK